MEIRLLSMPSVVARRRRPLASVAKRLEDYPISRSTLRPALAHVRHRHCSLTEGFAASHSIAPLLQWVRLARWPETAENGAVFLGALMKGKELHVLTAELERFRASFPGKIASVWLYWLIRPFAFRAGRESRAAVI